MSNRRKPQGPRRAEQRDAREGMKRLQAGLCPICGAEPQEDEFGDLFCDHGEAE
jgi:hypothetical protein